MKYLLDTHVWIWWNINPEKLTRIGLNIIKNTKKKDDLYLSVISTWEFSTLLEKKRLGLSCDPEEWLKKALNIPGLTLINLTPKIAFKSTTLPQPFHNDPADQIIVATARELGAVILTKDRKIQDYQYIKTIW